MGNYKSLYVFFLFLLLPFFSSCQSSSKKPYSIGVDPSWYPLTLEGKENQVTAFSTELLQEIGSVEKLSFVKDTVSWDNLLLGLQKKQYDAILTSMQPYGFTEKTYDFSDLYLNTGPVLIVPANSPVTSLEDLKGKEVAVQPGVKQTLILEKYPGILIRNYTSVPLALNALLKGEIDGALIDLLLAKSYIEDLYHEQLKIVTAPLDIEGLRLMTRHGDQRALIESFNKGLKKLKDSGKYDMLLSKWSL